jgi:two-component sensor histidine kinase
VLSVMDNGKGIPADIDIHSASTLGLRMIGILVRQMEGSFEVKRNNGTECIIRFRV